MWIRTAIKSPTTPCIWWKSLASPWETITVRIGLKFVSTMCSCDPTSLFPLVTPSCLALELPACLFPKAVCQPSLVLGIYLWYCCFKSLHSDRTLYGSLLWPSPHSSAWFGHRLGLFSRPSTSGGIVFFPLVGVVSRLFTPCIPELVLSINIWFTHSAFGSLPADLDTNRS